MWWPGPLFGRCFLDQRFPGFPLQHVTNQGHLVFSLENQFLCLTHSYFFLDFCDVRSLKTKYKFAIQCRKRNTEIKFQKLCIHLQFWQYSDGPGWVSRYVVCKHNPRAAFSKLANTCRKLEPVIDEETDQQPSLSGLCTKKSKIIVKFCC